jgi:hypothetical protein
MGRIWFVDKSILKEHKFIWEKPWHI